MRKPLERYNIPQTCPKACCFILKTIQTTMHQRLKVPLWKSHKCYRIIANYAEEGAVLDIPKNLYAIEFKRRFGTVNRRVRIHRWTERVTYPVQVWRKNDQSVRKVLATDKELKKVTVDPDGETADVNTENNAWPRELNATDFQKFKEKVKG